MSTSTPSDRDVLFIDLLGFSAAVETWDLERFDRLVALLAAISNTAGSAELNGARRDDGGYQIDFRPEVTTFSDHIVASYLRPFKNDLPDEKWDLIQPGWDASVQRHMQSVTAQIAVAALNVGLLIRGGISRGRLTHHGSIVIGEALIDAHRLESSIARGPRVVVSPRIANTFSGQTYIDADGKCCLEFVTAMAQVSAQNHADAQLWLQDKALFADETAESLARAGQAKEAAKWLEFSKMLRNARLA